MLPYLPFLKFIYILSITLYHSLLSLFQMPDVLLSGYSTIKHTKRDEGNERANFFSPASTEKYMLEGKIVNFHYQAHFKPLPTHTHFSFQAELNP